MHYDLGFLFSSLLVLQSTPEAVALLDFFKFDHGRFSRRADSFNAFDVNPNGSTFLWIPQDEYSGKTFFDSFAFFSGKDPTNGQVNYVNSSVAFGDKLAYVQDDGVVIMKGDDTTWLADGEYRKSVRISSYAQYNTGLFILDTNKIPWGCAIWPAFWTLGNGDWPYTGEIDIIEGVHDNQHNQVAFHTAPGCVLNSNAPFTGTVVQHGGQNNTECNGLINSNAGCGGGVFAMKWDENGIAVWSFFRAAVPQDVVANAPNPSLWGKPSALLEPEGCDPIQFFKNHSIIFDITFCGDWAGNSYATSGCPGTCADRLKDPGNFVNATWSINHLRVYRKQLFNGRVSAAASQMDSAHLWGILTLAMVCIVSLTYVGL